MEGLPEGIGAFAGAGGGVWLVLRHYLATLREGVNEAKQTAARAHHRIDEHLQSHKG